jgi:hypothetical protein
MASTKTHRELDAEARFKTYKDALIRIYGRGPLDSEQIDQFGKEAFGEGWRGVSGQEKVKTPMKAGYRIVNTSKTANSPGVHWMTLYVTSAGRTYTYDSFARSGVKMLSELAGRRKNGGSKTPFKDSDRKDAEQRGASAVCGHLSLAWLLVVRDLGVRSAILI